MATTTPRRRPILEGIILSPFLLWRRTRRGWRRWLLLPGYLAATVLIALPLRWLTVLHGLPDLGDPFDALAFRAACAVPDEENAFALYREARIGPPPSAGPAIDATLQEAAQEGWSPLDAATREWVEASRPALLRWRQGTARPRAQACPPGANSLDAETLNVTWDGLMHAVTAAALEGSRLQEAGDLVGAWGWYDAAVRASRHVMMGGASSRERHVGFWARQMVGPHIDAWLARADQTPDLLRRALADVQAARRMTPPMSDAFKSDYLVAVAELETLPAPGEVIGLTDHILQSYPTGAWLLRVWQREPERSRRLFRIIYAHWLAAADLPPGQRPHLISPQAIGNRSYPEFPYATTPGRRDRAHPLPAEELYGWFANSLYAPRMAVPAVHFLGVFDLDRRALEALEITIASRLFELERGREPERNRDLVTAGYLEAIPEGYDDGPDDEAGRR